MQNEKVAKPKPQKNENKTKSMPENNTTITLRVCRKDRATYVPALQTLVSLYVCMSMNNKLGFQHATLHHHYRQRHVSH